MLLASPNLYHVIDLYKPIPKTLNPKTLITLLPKPFTLKTTAWKGDESFCLIEGGGLIVQYFRIPFGSKYRAIEKFQTLKLSV